MKKIFLIIGAIVIVIIGVIFYAKNNIQSFPDDFYNELGYGVKEGIAYYENEMYCIQDNKVVKNGLFYFEFNDLGANPYLSDSKGKLITSEGKYTRKDIDYGEAGKRNHDFYVLPGGEVMRDDDYDWYIKDLKDKTWINYEVYKDKVGDLYLVDEDGNEIKNNGFYNHSRINPDGIISYNLFSGATDVDARYYINDGKIVHDDFIFDDGKVYYALSDGSLAHDTAIANRYYFGSDYTMEIGNIEKGDVEEAKKWIYYNKLYNTDKREEIVMNLDGEDRIFNTRKSMKDDINILGKTNMPTRAYDRNGDIIKSRFFDIGAVAYRGTSRYFADENGFIVKNEIKKINGKTYLFGRNGMLLKSDLLTESMIRLSCDVDSNPDFLKYIDKFVDADGVLLEEKATLETYRAGTYDQRTDVVYKIVK